MKSKLFAAVASSWVALATSHGAYVTGGSAQRMAGLGDAIAGSLMTGTGNATAAVVSSTYGGSWTERGQETSSGASGIFDVSLTSGSWGSSTAAGSWQITDPLFWSNYGMGAISMHVGNGGGNPDHWMWKLTPGQLSGTWDYYLNPTLGGGGGLSNLKLYSSGAPNTNVPDGGSTLLALGISLLGLGGARRFLKF